MSQALGNGKQVQFLLLSRQDVVTFPCVPHSPSMFSSPEGWLKHEPRGQLTELSLTLTHHGI